MVKEGHNMTNNEDTIRSDITPETETPDDDIFTECMIVNGELSPVWTY